jgi:hypothetical protein
MTAAPRGINVCLSSDACISSARARELAAALIEAADDVDRWVAK